MEISVASVKAKESLTVRLTGRAGAKAGLSDLADVRVEAPSLNG